VSDTRDPAIERRTQTALRAVFPAACEALRPFFDPSNHWAGQTHEHLALRTLKEQFPSLSAQEAFIVVATVKRLLVQGNYLENSDV
jgi:hypothetical protein